MLASPPCRYRAFISYSHRDAACAGWLHRALETYRVPANLVGRVTARGPVPKRLSPVFRDRAELPAADDLGAAIRAAIAESGHLVVICSPAAARSRWVDAEVAAFKRAHGESRILALIASGEPYATLLPGREDEECFPPSLRVRFDAAGHPTDVPAEPIAADLRPGKDGRRLALLKLAAGLTGLGLDDLAQRDAQRRIRRLTTIAASSVIGMLVAIGLAAYANDQRLEALRQRAVAQAQQALAQRESAAATSASDFLIGTFALANPTTENPRTITAVTILERGARRARTELAGQPHLEARLAATLSGAYAGLGLLQDAEQVVLASRGAIERAGPDGSEALLRLAAVYGLEGDPRRAIALSTTVSARLEGQANGAWRLLGFANLIEGRARAAQLDIPGGLAAFDRSIAAYERAPDARPGDVIAALRDKGQILSDDGQFKASDSTLLRALSLARGGLGDRHRVTASIWWALANNAFQEGDYPLAAQRLAPAKAILSRVVDPGNQMLGDVISMDGQIELGLKRFGPAVRSLTAADRIYRAAFRKPHFLVGINEVYLGLAQGGRGDLEDALAAFDRAKVQYDGSYGGLHANHGDLLVNRATVLAKFGRKREARADCAEGLRILGKTLGPSANYTRTMAATCATL